MFLKTALIGLSLGMVVNGIRICEDRDEFLDNYDEIRDFISSFTKPESPGEKSIFDAFSYSYDLKISDTCPLNTVHVEDGKVTPLTLKPSSTTAATPATPSSTPPLPPKPVSNTKPRKLQAREMVASIFRDLSNINRVAEMANTEGGGGSNTPQARAQTLNRVNPRRRNMETNPFHSNLRSLEVDFDGLDVCEMRTIPQIFEFIENKVDEVHDDIGVFCLTIKDYESIFDNIGLIKFSMHKGIDVTTEELMAVSIKNFKFEGVDYNVLLDVLSHDD